MSTHYQAIGWNPAKRRYDRTLLLLVLAALATFGGATALLQPDATAETILLRSFGFTAFALLHVILSIGPLCRLDQRFLPLLYNRRHLGVTMFVLALGHGTLATILYHTLGVLSPLASLFAGGGGGTGFADVAFQPFGAFALAILFLMAATSHDFWLRNLTAPVWKALHMGVYVAYGMLVLHIALGYLQSETSPFAVAAVALGMLWLIALHLLAGRREAMRDRPADDADPASFADVCAVDDIPEGGAHAAFVAGDRVAVFRHDGQVSAVSGVCKHQNGPLAEGRIVDGCITCPWHGYQYQPHDGCAPAPFTERLATFPVLVQNGRVLVGKRPNAPGTPVIPASVPPVGPAPRGEFYVGYAPQPSPARTSFTRRAVGIAAATCLLALALVAATQRQLIDSRFEFGVVRGFRGVVTDQPCPMLRVPRVGGTVSSYLLVAPGKHGAGPLIAPWLDRGVQLRGSLVHHDGQTMIEIQPDSLAAADVTVPQRSAAVPLGRFTLQGEIVDSKCHLGVMNPGERRTHRACAQLCIRGGIPPLLWVENEQGEVRRLLLVDVDGAAVNDRVLELVGDPVEITGDVEQVDDWLVLRADPATYRRVRRAPG